MLSQISSHIPPFLQYGASVVESLSIVYKNAECGGSFVYNANSVDVLTVWNDDQLATRGMSSTKFKLFCAFLEHKGLQD